MNVGAYYFMLNGVRVWLLDTPGFDDTNRLDSVVLKDIAYWLAGAYTKKVQLAGILYLHRITDVRMQGSALRNLRLFNELCGSNNLKSVVLATTHWTHQEGKSVPESVGQARVKELEDTKEFWGGMIDRGSRVVKHDGSKASATRIVSDLVNRHDHVTLDIQKQLVDEKRNLLETDAGQALRRELVDERKRSEARLVELKMDMESALREKDKTWQEQIKQDRLDLEARIRRGTQETEELKANLKKIAQEKDTQLREMERQFKLERAAWQQRLGELGAAMSKIEEHRGPSEPTKPDLSIQAEIVMPSRPKTITPLPEVSETDQDRQNRARAQEFVRWERRQLNALKRV